jgi:hypothetical protein
MENSRRSRTTAGVKRTASQLDEPSSIEREKICPDGQPISNLLADIEREFQRRKDEKESSFTKWEQEGL